MHLFLEVEAVWSGSGNTFLITMRSQRLLGVQVSSKPQPLLHGDYEAVAPPVTSACDYTELCVASHDTLPSPPGAVQECSFPKIPGVQHMPNDLKMTSHASTVQSFAII